MQCCKAVLGFHPAVLQGLPVMMRLPSSKHPSVLALPTSRPQQLDTLMLQVRIYNLESGTELTGLTIEEKCGITSIFISQDQRHLLLNLNQQRIHLHELGNPTTNSPSATAANGPVMKYAGSQEHKGRFVVRSCLGGINQAFVLSGSEDCKVRCTATTRACNCSNLTYDSVLVATGCLFAG